MRLTALALIGAISLIGATTTSPNAAPAVRNLEAKQPSSIIQVRYYGHYGWRGYGWRGHGWRGGPYRYGWRGGPYRYGWGWRRWPYYYGYGPYGGYYGGGYPYRYRYRYWYGH